MTEKIPHLALFSEEAIDAAAEAVERLHDLGVDDSDISVISGVPYSEKILGRPMAFTRIALIGLAGALGGFVAALALSFGTPYLYPIQVGGQPLYPIPTSIVVTFELSMLGLMLATFLGVFVETISPSSGLRGYHPKVSDGNIGVLYAVPRDVEQAANDALTALGAEITHRPEEKL